MGQRGDRRLRICQELSLRARRHANYLPCTGFMLCAARVLLASRFAFGQVTDAPRPDRSVDELRQSLASSYSREIAWAAHHIVRQKRQELVPNLTALVAFYQRGSIENTGVVPPEDAAIKAVADALIQLGAKLPGDAIMNLYPEFPAAAIILLSRASDNAAPLRFRVIANSDQPAPDSFVGGCAGGDFALGHVDAFRDWPRARLYDLVTDDPVQNIFAPGIQSVGFFSWETTDYVDHSGPHGSCSPEKSADWRVGLLAQLERKDLDEFPLEAEMAETLPYVSDASFEERTWDIVGRQLQAFRKVKESFVRSGLLSAQEATRIHLHCRIEVRDDRPEPHRDLPAIENKWCESRSGSLARESSTSRNR